MPRVRRRVRLSPTDAFQSQAQRWEARERTLMVVAAVSLLAAIAAYVIVLVARG
jgi:hypothetical protein